MFYWLMKYVVIGPIVKAIFRPWIVGRRNIPKTGAAILASNHLSFADSIFLPLMIDRPVTFLAKSDYFTGKGIKGWATRVFFKATGQLPIDRSGTTMIACFTPWFASLSSAMNISARDLPDAGGDLISRYCSPRWA